VHKTLKEVQFWFFIAKVLYMTEQIQDLSFLDDPISRVLGEEVDATRHTAIFPALQASRERKYDLIVSNIFAVAPGLEGHYNADDCDENFLREAFAFEDPILERLMRSGERMPYSALALRALKLMRESDDSRNRETPILAYDVSNPSPFDLWLFLRENGYKLEEIRVKNHDNLEPLAFIVAGITRDYIGMNSDRRIVDSLTEILQR